MGPLLEPQEETGQPSPLAPMNTEERLWADYRGTGLTIGKHPMAYRRAEMDALGVTRAIDLAQRSRRPHGAHRRIGDRAPASRHGQRLRVPQHGRRDRHHERHRHARTPSTATSSQVLGERFLLIDGVLQNLDGVISVKAARMEGLRAGAAAESHDFH